uniref:Protein kinase domain-containing protein n=1 Tax=Cebus imitator TaxID=2715852 RepID=A0A2K5SJ81_CEBIM
MSVLISKPEQIRTNEVISESIASFSNQEIMSSFLPEGWCYELLTVIGKGFEDLTTLNLARYKLTGEYVTARRINLEACSSEMVTFLQGKLHVSRLFKHPNIVPYQATFIADNELWVVTSFMTYGSAKDRICTHFMDGMNELVITYILQGVKALLWLSPEVPSRISRVMMLRLTSTVWESQCVIPTCPLLRICLLPRCCWKN